MPTIKSGSQSQKNKPLSPRKRLGALGEDLARDFFQRQGFLILDRNWSCRMGELDLVVQKGAQIRFVEVKTRQSLTYGYPEESVTRAKLSHLRKAAELWLARHAFPTDDWQVDVLAILILSPEKPDFHWLEGVA